MGGSTARHVGNLEALLRSHRAPFSCVAFIHPSGVKDPSLNPQASKRGRGGSKRGQEDPAQSHSGLSRCPSIHPTHRPVDGEERPLKVRTARGEARVEMPACCEEAFAEVGCQ